MLGPPLFSQLGAAETLHLNSKNTARQAFVFIYKRINGPLGFEQSFVQSSPKSTKSNLTPFFHLPMPFTSGHMHERHASKRDA